MARLLLLLTRTSYRAEAFLEAARRLNVDVTVGSNHRQALADHAAGGALVLDIAPVNLAVDTIVRYAYDYPLDGIVAAEDDFTPVAASASEALGLTHHPPDAVGFARNKAMMRERLAASGFRTPWYRIEELQSDPEDTASAARFPCVLKPLSLSASRGVIRANTPEEFVRAWKRIRRILEENNATHRRRPALTEILIEAYLPGKEVALEGIVTAGKLQTLAILDKPDAMEGPFFEETILVTPSRFSKAVQDTIASCVDQCAAILGLDDGPIHAELRVDGDRASLLEIAPRSIGGRCSAILRFDPAATLEELIVRHALDMPLEGFRRELGASGVMMLPIPRAGILREVAGIDAALEVSSIEGLEITIPLGQTVVPLPEGNRYLGFMFARADSPDHVETALRRAYARLDVKVERGGP